jgi:DnaJ-class molecular chaperone
MAERPEKHWQVVKPFEPYEQPCERCAGDGWMTPDHWNYDRRKNQDCPGCHGTGVELSEKGYDFIQFLKRYLDPSSKGGWQ